MHSYRGLRTLLLCGVVLAAGVAVFSWGAASDTVGNRFDTVVVDAGHGGDDHGARSRTGFKEKDLVLQVAKRLKTRLEKDGLRVVLTRSDDTFIPLEERTAIANDARGDLFISIHANAAKNRDARGVETYFLSLDATDADALEVANRENQAFGGAGAENRVKMDPVLAILGDLIATEQNFDSNEFARLTEGRLRELKKAPSRGVKQAPFVVLMGLRMPASLVEIGFITNPQDEGDMRTAEHQERLVDAISLAVDEFRIRQDRRHGVKKPEPMAEAPH